MSKRRDTRVEMNRPIELQGSRGTTQGFVLDFCLHGCRIQQADPKVHCGMRLTLRISLPDRIEPVEIKPAVVTWTRQDSFGVEFLTPSSEARSRVKLVHEQLLEAQATEDTDRIISLPTFA